VTVAEERALFERVTTLRRVKITLNEDEVWVLYRLLVQESRTPSVFPETDTVHRHALGMALAKLSDAHQDLSMPKETTP